MKNQKTVLFEYTSLTIAEHSVISMVMKGSAPFSGTLWEWNDNAQHYHINHSLLHQLKEALDTQMEDKYFVRFLMTIGEVESGGCVGNLEEELDFMDKDGAFVRAADQMEL